MAIHHDTETQGVSKASLRLLSDKLLAKQRDKENRDKEEDKKGAGGEKIDLEEAFILTETVNAANVTEEEKQAEVEDLLKKGMDVETIHRDTGYKVEFILKIQEEYQAKQDSKTQSENEIEDDTALEPDLSVKDGDAEGLTATFGAADETGEARLSSFTDSSIILGEVDGSSPRGLFKLASFDNIAGNGPETHTITPSSFRPAGLET